MRVIIQLIVTILFMAKRREDSLFLDMASISRPLKETITVRRLET